MARQVAEVDRRIEQAEQRAAAYRDRVAQVRADRTLSEVGRLRPLAVAYTGSSGEVRRLLDEVDSQRQARLEQLRSRALGAPQPLLASFGEKMAIRSTFRAALTEVRTVTDKDELRERLDTAHQAGDDVYARAVAVVALERGWLDVVNVHAARHLDWERDAQAFLDAQAAPTHAFRLAITTTIDKPAELAQFTEDQVARIASGEMVVAPGMTR